jgi:hypothetical protein
MTRRSLVLGTAAFALAALVGVGAARSSNKEPVLDDLHYLFQRRFETIDGDVFGVRRIPITPEHVTAATWDPKQPAEKKAAARLKASGRSAAFMVVTATPGYRGLVKPPYGAGLPPLRHAKNGSGWHPSAPPNGQHGISRPIMLTPAGASAPLPTYSQLVRGAKESIAALQAEDAYEFRAGKWTVHARPIRASRRECLKCHTGAKRVGDLLGVGLYAFATQISPKKP